MVGPMLVLDASHLASSSSRLPQPFTCGPPARRQGRLAARPASAAAQPALPSVATRAAAELSAGGARDPPLLGNRPLSARLPRRQQQHRQQQQQQQQQPWGATGPLRGSRRVAADRSGLVPDVPIPGDDQGSTIFTALSNAEPSGSSDEAEAAAAEEALVAKRNAGPVPHRWRVVGLMALSFVLCNMDKVNMSVAVIPMAKELGWTATERGLVSSAFFWGYALTQIPAGWVSTR